MSALIGGTAGAIVGGGLLSLGGSVVNGIASGNAASTQAAAADRATNAQLDMYNQTRADQQPWRQAGAQALGQMQDPSFNQTFNPDMMKEDPGYQFRMNQGMQALQASAAARGGALGGNTMQALNQYGQDYASNEYQNAYNRFTNDQSQRFNRLASIAGVGQTANGQVGAAGQNAVNNIGNIGMSNANAQAASGIATANGFNSSLNGISNNMMAGSLYNKMFPGSPAPQTPQYNSSNVDPAGDAYLYG